MTDLKQAVAEIKRITPPNEPWKADDLDSANHDFEADPHIATILNAVASGALVPVETIKRPTFPILGSKGAVVDLQLVADHGRQAYTNHGQTVTRLAERGGLSWSELHAVLHNRRWQKMDETEAVITCRGIEARYLTAWENCNDR